MTINEQAIRAATQAAQSVLESQDALHCTRVWEAWGYDTMTAHDFVPVAQDEEAVAEIVNSVLEAAMPHIREQIAAEALREAAAECWEGYEVTDNRGVSSWLERRAKELKGKS